jgi:hypothetical protein
MFKHPFNANRKTMRSFCALVFETCHAPQPLKAHRVKIVDQMMPKAASGGFQEGCFSAWYQGPKSVKDPPMEATKKLQANATANPRKRGDRIMF